VTVRTQTRLLARLSNARHGNEGADLRDLLASSNAQYSLATRTSSFQSLTNGSETILTWQNEVVDQLGIINLGTSTTLWTMQTAGLYWCSYLVTFAAEASFLDNQTNTRQGRISIDGNPASLDNLIGYNITVAGPGSLVAGSGVVSLAAGQTLQLNIAQASGETLAVAGQRMSVVRLSGG
jgi:hypothetical protein